MTSWNTSLKDLINKQDFTGAITLIEFEKQLQQNTSKSSSRRNHDDEKDDAHQNGSRDDQKTTQLQQEWLAWCYFHLADYAKSLEIYQELYESESDPIFNLYIACCLFQMKQYSESLDYAQKGPKISLQNRLLLHLFWNIHKSESTEFLDIVNNKLSHSTEDQLSLASLHYIRNHFQDATDIYKKEWMEHRNQTAIQIYVAFCFYQLDRYETSNNILQPYLNQYPLSVIALNLRACNTYRIQGGSGGGGAAGAQTQGQGQAQAQAQAQSESPSAMMSQQQRHAQNQQMNSASKNEIRPILDVMNVSQCPNPNFNIIRHNLVVFNNGENAIEVLPHLIEDDNNSNTNTNRHISEARLNLCIYYLTNEEYIEAYQLLIHLKKPKTAIEYILKAIVSCMIGQIQLFHQTHQQTSNAAMNSLMSKGDNNDVGLTSEQRAEKELKYALKYFELVGISQSECDTIPGRQCMASFHMLSQQFEDGIIYLESIKEFCGNSDVFNYNYGIVLCECGKFKEAESILLMVQNCYQSEYCFLSHLCRCYIMNGRPWEAWNLYLQTETNISSWNLLYLIANDCYKVGQFYYAAKAFDALFTLEPTQEYWHGKRGSCCGVFQLVIAGKEMKEHLLDIIQLLSNDTNHPQANFICRVMKQWCHQNGIQHF